MFKERLKEAVFGFIVGDCLGVPYEFKKRYTFICIDMIGNGVHNQLPGTFSDDTSMLLATIDSINVNNYTVNIEDMRNRYINWIKNGEYTQNNLVFDYGVTTYEALLNGHGLSDFYSNGNGSLMRILPLAFIDCTLEEIDEVSAITHAHEISKEACRIFVKIVREILNNNKLIDILDKIELKENFSRLKNLNNLKEDEIKSSGYVIDTLEASLWCILKSKNYKQAVLKAVNLGEDTDTIAAITGSLAALIFGYDDIPKQWIDKIRNKEIVYKYLDGGV